MDTANSNEWIGVAQVAAEMNLTDQKAWNLIKQLGVLMVNAERATKKTALFRRSDWEDARDRSIGQAPGRAPYTPRTANSAAPNAKRVSSSLAASKLAKLRSL